MADVTISGILDQAYYSSAATDATGAKTTSKGIGSQNNGTNEFTLSGSEDLGGGMKANFAINVQTDINASAVSSVPNDGSSTASTVGNGMAMRRSFVGLSSNEMGNVRLGNQWTSSFFVMLAADPTGALGGTGYVFAPTAWGAAANSVTYDLPTFMPGLAVQLQKGQGDEAAGSTSGQTTGGSLTYTTGAFMAAYGWQKLTASAAAIAGQTAATPVPAFSTSLGGNVLATLVAGDKISSNNYTMTYDLGMAKLYLGNSKDKVTGTTAGINASIYGVSIPVGANTKVALMTTSSSNTDAAGIEVKEKGSRYAVFHNLSKRTQLYAFTTKSSQSGVTNSASTNAFGIQHAF